MPLPIVVLVAAVTMAGSGCGELLRLPSEQEQPSAWVRLALESFDGEARTGAIVVQGSGGGCLWLHLSGGILSHRGSAPAATLSTRTSDRQQHVVQLELTEATGVLSALLHDGECPRTSEPDAVLDDAWCRLPGPCPPWLEETTGGDSDRPAMTEGSSGSTAAAEESTTTSAESSSTDGGSGLTGGMQ